MNCTGAHAVIVATGQAVHLLLGRHQQISEADFGTAVGLHRHLHRGIEGGIQKAERQAQGRDVRGDPRKGGSGAADPTGTLHGAGKGGEDASFVPPHTDIFTYYQPYSVVI